MNNNNRSSLSSPSSLSSTIKSTPSLSNATYRRNTRRRYHQQRRRRGFFLYNRFSLKLNNPFKFNASINNNNNRAWRLMRRFIPFGIGGSNIGNVGQYNSAYNGNYPYNSMNSGIGNTTNMNSPQSLQRKKRKQRLLLTILIVIIFFTWSTTVSSILHHNENGTSIGNESDLFNHLDLDRNENTVTAAGGGGGTTNANDNTNRNTNAQSVQNPKQLHPSSPQKQNSGTKLVLIDQNKRIVSKLDHEQKLHDQQKQQSIEKIIIQNNNLGNNNNNNKNQHSENSNPLHIGKTVTGAWANCTTPEYLSPLSSILHTHAATQQQQHPDQRMTIVSCHPIYYRIQSSKLLHPKKNQYENKNENEEHFHHNPLVIGVLSSAGTINDPKSYELGYQRRQAIRETWAMNQTGIFFIVAQPFNATTTTTTKNSRTDQNSTHDNDTKSPLEKEYDTYGDLIWIDEEELYNGEKSVLTYKSLSFVNIIHDLVSEYQKDTSSTTSNESSFVKYIFKTDDDCYVHIANLKHHLFLDQPLPQQQQQKQLQDPSNARDYWGRCSMEEVEPLRSKSNKWPVSYELYPEPYYPRYCQGAGFVLSWKFIHCAASATSLSSLLSTNQLSPPSSYNSPIANARFMPFEDVAMGLIAQRCNIQPTTIENKEWIHMYRFGRSEEVWRVNQGMKERMPKRKLPKPNMDDGRFVQHRIYDDWDMREHHKVVMLGKERYDVESNVEWYYRPER